MQKKLYKARLLLEEGRTEAALDELKTVQINDDQQDISYLTGWAYIQLGQWEQARQILTPLLEAAYENDEGRTLADREHLAYYLLKLGAVAIKLAHYEEATKHLHACLKVLHDRRVHLPDVRIKVRYYMGMTCVMRGLTEPALENYEEALRLCEYYGRDQELPDVYHGLAETYRRASKYEEAYEVAQTALQLYRKQKNERMECQIQNMLGSICYAVNKYKEAADHYTESLALASVNRGWMMIMLDCTALADLRLAENNIDEAKRYCEMAEKTLYECEYPQLAGAVYHIIGKVAYKEYQQAEGPQRQKLLNDAIKAYEEAVTQLEKTQARADIAKVSGEYANILEELGRTEDAIKYWRVGYDSLKNSKA